MEVERRPQQAARDRDRAVCSDEYKKKKKQSKNEFKFKSVEKGETKMVSGTNYRLILVVKDGKNCYQQCIIYGGGK